MDGSAIRALRERTGLCHRLCHQALVAGLNDAALALLWLREQGHLPARDWTWEQGVRGPSAFLELEVVGQAAALSAVVAQTPLSGYSRLASRGPMTASFRPPLAVTHELHVDWSNAERFAALARGEPAAGLWAFSMIAIGGGRVWFENGYGFRAGECLAAQADLLEAILGSPRLAVGRWSVEFGGDGYPISCVAAGSSRQGLIDYAGLSGR